MSDEKKPLVKFLIRTEYTFYSEKPFNELFERMRFANPDVRKRLLRKGKVAMSQEKEDGRMFTHYEILRGTELLAYEVMKTKVMPAMVEAEKDSAEQAEAPKKIDLRVTGERKP